MELTFSSTDGTSFRIVSFDAMTSEKQTGWVRSIAVLEQRKSVFLFFFFLPLGMDWEAFEVFAFKCTWREDIYRRYFVLITPIKEKAESLCINILCVCVFIIKEFICLGAIKYYQFSSIVRRTNEIWTPLPKRHSLNQFSDRGRSVMKGKRLDGTFQIVLNATQFFVFYWKCAFIT